MATETRTITHPEAQTITREELIARARAMVPVLRERARATEDARRLLPETLREFIDAGFFRICQPRRFGGFELGIDVLEEVMIELGRGCGSSAWNMGLLSGHNWWLGACLDEEAQAEVFGSEGDVRMPASFTPQGNTTARRVEGGYVISGRWPYMSGIDVANWFNVALVTDEGEALAFIGPMSEATIDDDWRVLGMRGTGSKTVVVDEVFVPERRVLNFKRVEEQDLPGMRVHANPLYRAPLRAYLVIEVTGVAVGIAQQACDVLDEVARTKPVRAIDAAPGDVIYTSAVAHVRHRLADARTLADTAQALLIDEARGLMAKLHEYALSEKKMAREEISESGLNIARAIDLCVQAVSTAYGAAGTSAAFDTHPLQRCLRDIYTISSHGALRFDAAAETWGLDHFGLESPLAVQRTLTDAAR